MFADHPDQLTDPAGVVAGRLPGYDDVADFAVSADVPGTGPLGAQP
ncbi:hypothetical protein Y717_17640 [Streptomyces scopuliridis RB72]|uniref:Uncharacterized protein n=1 Tax=Streptomyces scopuliridis RB72 TaxID=1440053 RepID=A0A2T7T7E1_9ACTN|nr:hypothetical protein [Streptomyces scopuliridis]PVE11090.1 hypothetical protein Y717_17640 [Streptomyces scopuliridis RB72]